jgi:uncharacterized protein Usg
LATAEITYRLPDHPSLLQIFVWQHLDLAPSYPELHKFLAFWAKKIEGRLHSVRDACRRLPSRQERDQAGIGEVFG